MRRARGTIRNNIAYALLQAFYWCAFCSYFSYLVAYLLKNEQLIIILAGVIATNATSVVNFYVGSSASSQAKDDTISKQLPK